MKANILLVVGLFFGLTAFTQNSTYQGLLWKIDGNGLTQPSYLYGTMHVSNKVAFHLSDSFYRAIESVDVVSLEINPETWMETMTSDDYVADKMGNVFSVRGNGQSSGFYKKMFEKEQPENKAIGASLGAELGVLNSLLYRTSNYTADFQEDTYLDLFIYQAGRKQGKEITGLERLGATMKLNELAAKPVHDKKKKKALKEIAEEKRHKLRKMLDGKPYGEVMENAYRLGDLDLLDSMSRLAGSDKNHDLIIVYRNKLMADSMHAIMQQKSLFAGIGAAHLPNDYGVINLLRDMGYNVTAVKGEETDYAKDAKEKLEETFISHTFSKQTSFDGSFSTMMPGPLYEFPEANETRMAAYPDMANGAKYVVTRINTYGSLYGLSTQDYLNKLDSLFFENIPGKILSKERIEIDGIPGFDIRNETKKGDKQRYHVMVTPLEIMIFKVSGKKDFVNRKEVSQFFSELHFYKGDDWTEFSPANNAYSVSLPGTLSYEAENNAFMRGFWSKTVQSYDSDKGYFAVMNKGNMDMEYMEEDSFELHHIARYYTEQFDYTLLEKKHDSTQGYASFYARAENDEKADLYLKEVLVGNQYYMLTAQTNDKDVAMKFFESVEFLPFKFKRPFMMQHDTARMFSVVSNVRPPVEVSSYYNYYRDDDESDDTHEDETKTAIYYSKESDETIYARMYKYHKYYGSEEVDSLWSFYKEQMRQQEFFMRSEKKGKVGEMFTYELSVGDTNTHRNILVKHIIKDGALFSLFTENDYQKPRSEFVKQFYETFTPWDTVIGTPVIQNKVDLFLGDLISEDSTTREAAYQSFDQISFEDSDAPKVIKAYQKDNGFKHSFENRAELLSVLQDIKHPSIVPFLVKEYKQVGDSVQFQIPILKALAGQLTKKSSRHFASLIVEETPLTDNENAIAQMFYPFYDSTSVAKELFPEILMLTALPEYKDPVYDLLSSLKDSGFIKSRLYRKHFKQLAWEANNEIKRHKGSESNQTADFFKEETRQTLYNYNDLLEYYATLLQPYHKKSKVKRFYDRGNSVNSAGFKIDLALIRLKGGEKLPESTWSNLSKNKNDRIVLYQRLKDMNRLDLFPSKYNHDTLAMALFAQKARINQYKDSLVFVSKHWVSDDKDSGFMYFFKSKEKNEDWEYGYLGPIDTTVAEVERYTYEFEESFSFNKYEDEALQIRKQVRTHEMRNRNRYRVSDDPEFSELKTKYGRYNRYRGF